MVKIYEDTVSFYSTVVRFLDEGEERVVYTDSPSLYTQMQTNDPVRITNMTISNVEPTEEQEYRLEVFKDIMLNNKDQNISFTGFISQINNFVMYGYIDIVNGVSWLKSLASDYTESSKAYLLSKYKELLSDYKTLKEQSGTKYNGYTIKTDPESQSKITGTMVMMQTGGLDTIQFKAADGWLELNTKTFGELAKNVAMHIQLCFKSESELVDQLGSLTLTELIKLDPDYEGEHNLYKDYAEKPTNIYNLYDAKYNGYAKTLGLE